jgi:aminoglycoside 3-N-acetyltransferase
MEQIKQKSFVTKSQLIADLKSLGVQAGDTVMLHVSVKAVGWVVGGPRVILEALLEVLSEDGTLMMLASWEGNPYGLENFTKTEQKLWLEECPAFDPNTSPADHRDMGILSEYLRTWPRAFRSHHPMASFVAVGKRAEWLTENHPLHYGMGLDSPLARLCEVGGKVLLLGTAFSELTLLHYAEHLVDLPSKRIDRYKMPVLQNGEKVWLDIEEFDTTNGIADFGIEDYFSAIGNAYVSANQNSSAKVGKAQTYLIQAERLTAFAVPWMKQNYKR